MLGAGCAVQNRAVANLFRGPNMIEDVASTMRRLEDGDLKLRVRALDAERAVNRVLVRPQTRQQHPDSGSYKPGGFRIEAPSTAAIARPTRAQQCQSTTELRR